MPRGSSEEAFVTASLPSVVAVNSPCGQGAGLTMELRAAPGPVDQLGSYS